MTKSDIVALLPEFENVEEQKFNTLIASALALFPEDEYVDENLAKAYFVANYYFESQRRMAAMANMGKKSEKIDDILITFNDVMSEENPYSDLFENMKVSTHACNIPIGFTCAD